jgi:hypothetical protein
VVACCLAGCQPEAAPESESDLVVYFDTATKRPVAREESVDIPAMHPRTGKRTLMPAVYCPKCRRWRQAPPIEQMQRDPKSMVCPKDGTALTADGPIPEDS